MPLYIFSITINITTTTIAAAAAAITTTNLQVLELVNGGGGPDVGVMEVWTKPCLSKTQQQQLKSSQPPPMTLLYSLSTGAGAGTTSSDQAAGHPVGLAALEVLLGSKAVGVVGGTEGRVLPSGAGIKLALLRCAGMAEEGAGGGRDGTVVSATEVLVKYSAKVGGAYHRQLRLPVRLAVRGGLRVCSLRVSGCLPQESACQGGVCGGDCLMCVNLFALLAVDWLVLYSAAASMPNGILPR